MIGLNMLFMWINAKFRGDSADKKRIENAWGFKDPSLDVRWRDLGVAVRRKPWKLWHRFKHLIVEWTRLDANRAGKLFLDWIVWALFLGIGLCWLVANLGSKNLLAYFFST